MPGVNEVFVLNTSRQRERKMRIKKREGHYCLGDRGCDVDNEACKNSMKSSSDAEAKKSKGKEKDKEREVNTNTKKSTSTTTALPTDVTPNNTLSVGISLSTTRKNVQANWIEEPIPDEAEQPKFCCDGSTTVVFAKADQTIKNVLGKLCEKRNISVVSVDIFLLGSDKPLNLAEDVSMLGSKEVIIEKRVLFWMDLPNKKSIGVKAKPNRMIQDVFKLILHKYGFRIDSIDIYLSGHTAVLDLEGLVSSLDNQRVVVVSKDESQGNQRRRSSLFGFIGKRVHRNGSKGSCIDKDETKGHIAFQKNEVRKHPNDGDDLCHLLKTASSRSLDDQHGVSMQDLELPEFLQKSERPLPG